MIAVWKEITLEEAWEIVKRMRGEKYYITRYFLGEELAEIKMNHNGRVIIHNPDKPLKYCLKIIPRKQWDKVKKHQEVYECESD